MFLFMPLFKFPFVEHVIENELKINDFKKDSVPDH